MQYHGQKNDESVPHVLVVGGSGSIGEAVVQRFLTAAWEVTVADRQASRISDPSLTFVRADVTEAASIAELAVSLEAASPLRQVVSLAGGALSEEYGPLVSTDAAVVEQSIAVNLTAHIHIVRSMTPLLAMATRDRAITLVSSINALRDYGLPAYSAAKAGLLGLVAAQVGELGAHGIRINAVLPGTVRTARTEHEPKDFAALARATAMGRAATAREVAEAIYALSGLTAVTGQGLVVDCGQSVATAPWRESVDEEGRS